MKYLYVCVSSERDCYLEQLFASVVTLKAKTPNASVTLLIDKDTEKSLVGGRENIKKLIDELIAVEFPRDVSQKVRSRLLKTQMRNLVDGDFLYIDTDTFIFEDLSPIGEVSASLAGVQDKHCPLSENDQAHTNKQLKRVVCGNPDFVNEQTFINGGVLLVRDTAGNREFFREWNGCYLANVDKGVTQDMPSLALINFRHGHCIAELDGSWNCQLEFGAQYFRSARIFHYFASHTQQKSLNALFEFIRKSGFDCLAQKLVREDSERIAFDFGTSVLITGIEQEVQKTACYRFVILLYSKFRRIFNLCEKILSLGRGHGLYFKAKKS